MHIAKLIKAYCYAFTFIYCVFKMPGLIVLFIMGTSCYPSFLHELHRFQQSYRGIEDNRLSAFVPADISIIYRYNSFVFRYNSIPLYLPIPAGLIAVRQWESKKNAIASVLGNFPSGETKESIIWPRNTAQ